MICHLPHHLFPIPYKKSGTVLQLESGHYSKLFEVLDTVLHLIVLIMFPEMVNQSLRLVT